MNESKKITKYVLKDWMGNYLCSVTYPVGVEVTCRVDRSLQFDSMSAAANFRGQHPKKISHYLIEKVDVSMDDK